MKMFAQIITGILLLAILAVVIKKGPQSTSLISAFTGAIARLTSVAVNPQGSQTAPIDIRSGTGTPASQTQGPPSYT